MTWLTGWNRRKSIIVTGASSAQSDYQMKLIVNQGSGTDSPGVIYLGGNILSNFDDLRFTKSDGSTPLNYWIESITGTSPNQIATVWAKLAPSPDTIPASPGTYSFYIYYNNTSATPTSDGTNTFLLFDDFSGDLSKWTTYQSTSGNVQIVGGSLRILGDGANYNTNGVTSVTNIPTGNIIEFDLKYTTGAVGVWGYSAIPFDSFNKGISFLGQYTGSKIRRVRDGAVTDLVSATISDTFVHCKLILKSGQGYTLYYNNILQEDDTTWTNPNGANKVMFEQTNSSYYSYIDNVRVRKYASPEPTFGCSGGEEVSVVSWLSGWNRRRSKVINGSTSGAQTNYQMRLTVHKVTGTDGSPNAYDIYLGTNVRDDFGDVRFAKQDGSSLLNYWIESISGTSAIFWVQVDSIPISPCITSIYIYYDYPSQTTTSNGTNTFEIFDNFDSLTGWTQQSGSWSVSSSIVTYPSGAGYLRYNSALSLSDGYVVDAKVMSTLTAKTLDGFYLFKSNNPLDSTVGYRGAVRTDTGSVSPALRVDNSAPYYGNYDNEENVWNILEMIVPASPGYPSLKQLNTARTLLGSASSSVATTSTNNYFGLMQTESDPVQMDWILVRKYVSPEPTWSCSGGEEVATVLWITGWNRRKSVTINGSTAGVQTNYQMQVNIYRSSGTDSSNTVYVGTNVNTDFSDVRFTKSDGVTLLNYWIDPSSIVIGTSAIAWVQVDSIPSSPCTTLIYLYYNNTSASTTSNGINTFVFFDDFNTYDTLKWTSDGTPTVSNSIISLPGISPWIYLKSITTFGTNYAVHWNTNVISSAYAVVGFSTAQTGDTGNNYIVGFYTNYGSAQHVVMNRNGSPSSETYTAIGTYSGYNTLETIRNDITNSIFKINGIQKATISINLPSISLPIGLWPQGQTINADWVFVRKYISPEPIFGIWSMEESIACSNPSCNLVVMEILSEQLSRQFPEYIDIELMSKLIDNFK